MCEWPERDLVDSSKAEICDFDKTSSVDKQILWLHITMNDSAGVTEVHRLLKFNLNLIEEQIT